MRRIRLRSSFVYPRHKVESVKNKLHIKGLFIALSNFRLNENAVEFYVGQEPIESKVRLIARIPGSVNRYIFSVDAAIGAEQLGLLPIHSPLRLHAITTDGEELWSFVKYSAFFWKYLALHGPYWHPDTPDLATFFRQNVSKNVSLTTRHANITDTTSYCWKLRAAWFVSKLLFWKNPLVLFEKAGRHYEESGRTVFEKLVDSGEQDVWFVLDKATCEQAVLEERYRSKILIQHSFRHYLYFFCSKRFMGSETLMNSLEPRCQSILAIRKTKNRRVKYIFLQHGVMYMVSLNSPSRTFFKKRNFKVETHVVVSSQREADHFIKYARFRQTDLIISGLPKFDTSYLNPGANKILIMPTWRPWEFVSDRADYTDSRYFKMIQRMHDAIPESLRENVVVLPHPLLGSALFGKSTEIATNYDELLRDASMLITDYSSISYDAFYRGANVVFYWEEKNECLENYGEGTRLMLNEMSAFGPVCFSPDQLRAVVGETYGKPQHPEYVRRYREIVTYHDGRNTERLIEAARNRGFLKP